MPAIRSILIVLFALILFPVMAAEDNAGSPITTQSDTSGVIKPRLWAVVSGGSVLVAGTMGGLYYAWYKDHPLTSFHFHDDLHDWLQMDKAGHLVSSYYIGLLGYESLRWAGVDNTTATWLGGTFGTVYLATIEILDGFSAGWGASLSDVAANTLGSAMFVSQQLLWNEQRVLLKYSYWPTKFADYRPDVLGSNHLERMFKDYNGITVWLSVNPHSFGANQFPKWLNLSVGYGATGMTGGSENISGYHNGIYIPEYERTRRYFLSFDIDLTRIETRNSSLGLLLKAFGFIRIPFPAIELDANKKFRFHPLYL